MKFLVNIIHKLKINIPERTPQRHSHPHHISPPPSLDAHAWFLDDETIATSHHETTAASHRHSSLSTQMPLIHLLPPDGTCACAYDSMPAAIPGRLVARAPRTHGPSSGGPRAFHMSEERALLRIVAPVHTCHHRGFESHMCHIHICHPTHPHMPSNSIQP